MTRLGAVDYLNVRPLVHGLDRRPDLVSVRFDAPSECARLLEAGEIDLGMVPSITYLNRPGDHIVPGLCIGSDGPVESVALFLRSPLRDVRTLAVDTSSRTSGALTRILCARRFDIAPTLVPHAPELNAMRAAADGALVIGDPALYYDNAASGLVKTDLGEQWTVLTGLPFVWAFWAGRPGAVPSEAVAALQAARDAGVFASDTIAATYCGPDRAALGRAYLRDNIYYTLDERERTGLERFYELAEKHGVVETARAPAFYRR